MVGGAWTDEWGSFVALLRSGPLFCSEVADPTEGDRYVEIVMMVDGGE